MKTNFLIGTMILSLLLPGLVMGEEQAPGRSGRIEEYRQQHGNVTYTYDAYRNLAYIAIGIVGGKGAIDFRDSSGVHLGVGGPGMLPFSVHYPMKTPAE
jgi:hypothetical protein